MVLLDSLLVGGIEDAPDFVFFLIEKDIVVRYPEFIRGGRSGVREAAAQ